MQTNACGCGCDRIHGTDKFHQEAGNAINGNRNGNNLNVNQNNANNHNNNRGWRGTLKVYWLYNFWRAFLSRRPKGGGRRSREPAAGGPYLLTVLVLEIRSNFFVKVPNKVPNKALTLFDHARIIVSDNYKKL